MTAAEESRPPPGEDGSTPPGRNPTGPNAGDLVGAEIGFSLDAPADHLQLRSMADRVEAARRLPPLRSGYRDPDGRRTDAPDADYLVWAMAQHLADTSVPPRRGGDR